MPDKRFEVVVTTAVTTYVDYVVTVEATNADMASNLATAAVRRSNPKARPAQVVGAVARELTSTPGPTLDTGLVEYVSVEVPMTATENTAVVL